MGKTEKAIGLVLGAIAICSACFAAGTYNGREKVLAEQLAAEETAAMEKRDMEIDNMLWHARELPEKLRELESHTGRIELLEDAVKELQGALVVRKAGESILSQ